MMIADYNTPAPNYKKYRSAKFEKVKTRIHTILKGISDTSLTDSDKTELIQEIKTIVNNY